MSRNDIVLFACGSRSISNVGLPRRARAAARLIAVVVFPTPPFWLAMATIIEWRNGREDCMRGPRICQTSHLVFPQILGIQALQPFLQPIAVGLIRREVDGLGVI